MGGSKAPGYRFYPTEEELLSFYLCNKLQSSREDMDQVIPVADVYCFDPWELPPMSGVACREDGEQWFFFCPRQEREAQGGRPTRTTPSGYWKATGSPSLVFSSMNRAIGVKKTMVFYRGRAPTGAKTKWKMNEYRMFEEEAPAAAVPTSLGVGSKTRREFSLCRVYTRSGCIRSFDRRPLDPPASDDAAGNPFATPPPAAAVGTCKRTRTDDDWTSSSASSGGDATSWRSVRRRGGDDDNNNNNTANNNNDINNHVVTLTEEDDYFNLILDTWL